VQDWHDVVIYNMMRIEQLIKHDVKAVNRVLMDNDSEGVPIDRRIKKGEILQKSEGLDWRQPQNTKVCEIDSKSLQRGFRLHI